MRFANVVMCISYNFGVKCGFALELSNGKQETWDGSRDKQTEKFECKVYETYSSFNGVVCFLPMYQTYWDCRTAVFSDDSRIAAQIDYVLVRLGQICHGCGKGSDLCMIYNTPFECWGWPPGVATVFPFGYL